MKPAPAAITAAACSAAALLFFLDPIVSRAATIAAGEPVRFTEVRLRGLGDFSAVRARLGPEDDPRATVEGVRVRGVLASLFGGTLRVRFRRAESAMGHARGGLHWKSGRLIKAHARVSLLPAGLSRVPSAWLKRLLQAPDGPAFYAFYAAGRITLRGRAGPILEAAWRPG